MSRPLPKLIDPQRLCGKGRNLQGALAVKHMGRLQDILSSGAAAKDEGNIDIDLAFRVDSTGQSNVSGTIDVALWIRCQRCLGAMRWCKKLKLSLAVVSSELEVEKLPSKYEPLLISFSDDENLCSLAEIVESEIILALPQEARHKDHECSIDDKYIERNLEASVASKSHSDETSSRIRTKKNPFAVLKQMKDKK